MFLFIKSNQASYIPPPIVTEMSSLVGFSDFGGSMSKNDIKNDIKKDIKNVIRVKKVY